jgi:BolA protein
MVARMDTRSLIHERLQTALEPTFIDVVDESAAHRGHAGAASGGGHFRVILVADTFEGLSQVARQRRVYEVLADDMRSSIHALSMTCLTPAEYDSN